MDSNKIITFILSIIIMSSALAQTNWTHRVRIAGNPLSGHAIDSIINSAVKSNVYGIEVDNDITGRYESFLDPSVKLDEIRRVTEAAHKVNNKTFVYIAGLECITENADSKEHTFYKDHPDWVQRDISGRPAIFGGNDAFWISEGDEDVWISPYAAEWRRLYMQRVREIAETGIDGVYVDIPYWMTHFEGWENTWASFDEYTVEEFRKTTGLDAKKDIKLGDYNDPGFIKWINFRMNTLTDFMAEIDRNVKEVNPACMTIAEIYPGIGEEAVRVGADVFQMYNVVDVIAHEYSEGEYYASDRALSDWYNYIIGMRTFRAFAGDKASWMLSYSWVDNKNVRPADAMKSLFASQLFSGTNMWDVKGYVMSSTNDMPTRTEVYKWVSDHEKIFYPGTDKPVDPVSVYFSDYTRNYFSEEFLKSYRGIINLLMHSHIPYQIITSRTLQKLNPDVLIMPDVKSISDEELESLNKLENTKFILTGDFAEFDQDRKKRTQNSLVNKGSDKILYLKDCPGKDYTTLINRDLNKHFASKDSLKYLAEVRKEFIERLKLFASYEPDVKIDAPADIISRTNLTDEGLLIYLLNTRAVCEACGESENKTIDVKISLNSSLVKGEVSILPFLGSPAKLNTETADGLTTLSVPGIERGTVVIIKGK